MKPAITFFLLVIFLLSGGRQSVNAIATTNTNRTPITQDEIKTLVAPAGNSSNKFFTADTKTTDPQEDLLLLVADEDDEQDDISHKSLSNSIGFTAFFYAFVSNYAGSNTNCCAYAHKPLLYTSSCKYIEQRSLRI